MTNMRIWALFGMAGVLFACSSDEDEGNGGTPVNATVAPPNSAGTITSITLPGNVVVPVIDNGLGQRVAVLPDGTVVTVLPDGSVVTGNQNQPPSDWDASYQTDACQTISRGTTATGGILQFVIDKSTSMNESAPSTNGDSKWGATREALNRSFPTMDPTLAIGEFFYPNDEEDGCVIPGQGGVEIAPLTPDHVQALIAGVNAVEDPTNPAGTPTHDAWREGFVRLQRFLASPPPGYETARGYVVLVTDGMPVRTLGCGPAGGDNIAVTEEEFDEFIADVTQTTQSTGISTFVIGVPGSENENQVPTDPSGNGVDYVPRTKLSEVAVAGRTAIEGCSTTGPNFCHIDMVETDDFVTGLQAALGTIMESVVSCQYPVPDLGIDNVFINLDDVIMNYLPGGQGPAIALLQSRDGCATGSWVYNDDQTMITLCDVVCSTVRADPNAEMQVYFGCVVPQ